MPKGVAAPSVTGTTASAHADAYTVLRERGKPKPPDDFKGDPEGFVRHARELFDKDKEADRTNRDEMVQDHRFVAGEQWDPAVRQRRSAANKPTLTINRLPAYVAQLIGNRRLNDVGIKIIADTDAHRKTAEVREGLIRSIQKNSRAQWAYDKTYEQVVIGGLGNFQVHLDYAHDDVFEQDIRIASIPNPLSVVWDQNSVEPSGSDAHHVFVVDEIPRKEFKRRYPNATAGDFDAMSRDVRTSGWVTDTTVQVVSFWRVRSRERLLALLQNGDVVDVTDRDPAEWWDFAQPDPADGLPMVREVQRKYAEMYLLSASDILAGPYELPIRRVPVFRVPGWELFVEGDRIRWGLVRFLRDPQKLFNYWRSTIAEKLVGSPKAKWVAPDNAVEGREDQWRRSHLDDDPLLVYNSLAGQAPTRVHPVEMEQALIQEAGMAAQDIRDVSNIHEAALGQTSNEVSGRAIMARQRVSEISSVIYQDNLNIAIEEAGSVINDLIPIVYDTPRVIKVLGPDLLTEDHVRINDKNDPTSVDVTTGKYTVSVTTGPSYTTRRVEAREEMMAMVNAMPDTMAVAADKIVEAQDWPGADEIAKRLRSRLPPDMVSDRDLDETQIQQRQAAAQAAQQQQQLQQQAMQLELALKQAQALEAQARAQEAQARAEQAVTAAHRNLSGAAKDEAQAAKALAEIEQGRLHDALAVVDRITPPPAMNADTSAR